MTRTPMRTLRSILILLGVLAAATGASAQTQLYAGLGAGYARGELAGWHGASADLSAAFQWHRLLLHLHAADVRVERERQLRRLDDGSTILDRPWDADFSAALDAGYVLPLSSVVGLSAGAGLRYYVRTPSTPTDERFVANPYTYVGALVGASGGLRPYGRLELDLGTFRGDGVSRVQLGVLVPLGR